MNGSSFHGAHRLVRKANFKQESIRVLSAKENVQGSLVPKS